MGARRLDLIVEDGLRKLLSSETPLETGELIRALAVATKWMAVKAKLEEAKWGEDLDELGEEEET